MTPAIDLCVKHNIQHKVHAYRHDPQSQSYGLEAAEMLGVDPQTVFKTLVVELSSGTLAVGIVPVTKSLNLKSVSKSCGVKKALMADPQKVQRITGYVLGGVSPLGQKKMLKTVIDASANTHSKIYVSAGKRGLEIELKSSDLITLCKANFSDIAT